MELSDERLILAPRSKVWTLLNDPDVLKDCIPGCEELVAEDATHMTGTIANKIGPITARFKGSVTLENLDEPSNYSIVGEGKGGIAGFAKGKADIILDEHPAGTILKYTVNVAIGGKIAQLGSRLITTTAKKLSETFFERFATRAAESMKSDTA